MKEIHGIKLDRVEIIKWPDNNGELWLVENTSKIEEKHNTYFPIGKLSKIIDDYMTVKLN